MLLTLSLVNPFLLPAFPGHLQRPSICVYMAGIVCGTVINGIFHTCTNSISDREMEYPSLSAEGAEGCEGFSAIPEQFCWKPRHRAMSVCVSPYDDQAQRCLSTQCPVQSAQVGVDADIVCFAYFSTHAVEDLPRLPIHYLGP